MSSPGEEATASSSSSSSSTVQPTLVTDNNSSTPEIMDPSALLIKVLSPAENFPSDLAFRVLPKSTVGELKRRISAALEFRPDNDQQRLIYRGKMLTDELVVGTVLGLGPGKDGGAGETPQEAYTFHLVIKPPATSPTTTPINPFLSLNPSNPVPPLPSSPSPPPQNGPTTTTTTTRSFAAPGSSSSIVTTTTTRITTTVLPRNGSPSIPSAGGVPNFSPMSLDELRQTLRQRAQATEQQQDNLASRQRLTEDLARMNEALGQRITAARQNFNSAAEGAGRSTGMSISGLGPGTTIRRTETTTARYGSSSAPIPSTGFSTPTASGSGIATSPSEGVTRAVATTPEEMRGHISQMLNLEGEARRRALLTMQQEEAEDTTNFAATGSSQSQTTLPQSTPTVSNNNLLGGNNLIYLLQDASGTPTALLIGPPGSAGQAPVPRVDIGWQPGAFAMPDGVDFGHIPQEHRALRFPAPGVADHHDIFNAAGFGFEDPHARAALNRQRNRGPLNIGDMFAGVRARATHFWLAVRLAVFVVLFTGSGGWRRMLYLGSIAVLIFIWQTGIFNEFFRPIIEAINPPPPNAAAFPPPRPAPAANNPNQPQFPDQANQPLARDANGNPVTPAQTANMLVARRDDRLRELFRGVERGVTIFLASLIPGLHERHVDAVEARQREAQQLRDAQEAANAAAAGEVEGEGTGVADEQVQAQTQVQQQDQQQGAGAEVPAVNPEPEIFRGLL